MVAGRPWRRTRRRSTPPCAAVAGPRGRALGVEPDVAATYEVVDPAPGGNVHIRQGTDGRTPNPPNKLVWACSRQRRRASSRHDDLRPAPHHLSGRRRRSPRVPGGDRRAPSRRRRCSRPCGSPTTCNISAPKVPSIRCPSPMPSSRTSRHGPPTVRLGVLATSVLYRNPALLGKIVTTLDVLSGGRAILGIGAGHPRTEHEHVAYGYDFPDVARRMDRARRCARHAQRPCSAPSPRAPHLRTGRAPPPPSRSSSPEAGSSACCASPLATPTWSTCRSHPGTRSDRLPTSWPYSGATAKASAATWRRSPSRTRRSPRSAAHAPTPWVPRSAGARLAHFPPSTTRPVSSLANPVTSRRRSSPSSTPASTTWSWSSPAAPTPSRSRWRPRRWSLA